MLKHSFSIILIIIAILAFVFVIRPNYADIKNLQLKKDEYGLVLDNAKKLQSIRDDLIEKKNAISISDTTKLSKFLPDDVDNVKLILELETIAQDHNIELQTASSSTNEDEEDGSALDVETKDYGIINLEFELFGSYSDFVDFLREVSTALRLTDIEALSFKEDITSPGQFQFDLVLKTYWVKDNI